MDGLLTTIAIWLIINCFDTEHIEAYVLENGSFANCDKCIILEDLENESKR